jgi:hypothetical protein
LTILNNGNVGIGTTSPSATLDVNGGIRVATLTAASATAVCRDAGNNLSTCSSSRKFKSNITYLTGPDYASILEQIRNTSVAHFTYKTDHPDMVRYGIIAEESPHALQYIDEHNNTNIDFYSVQTGYTWAGIKALDLQQQELNTTQHDQQARIDALNTTDESLTRQVATLTAENQALRERLDALTLSVQRLAANATG